MRKEFKGHFIDSKTVSEKWMKGYKNLDLNFSYFDKVIVVDNSIDKEPFSVIVTIEKQKKTIFTSLPSYFNERLPILSKSILI